MSFVENVGRRQNDSSGILGAWVDLGEKSLNGYERNRLYRNLGRGANDRLRFADDAHLDGANRLEDGRAAVPVDIDRDGDLDLLVQNFERPVVLLINNRDRTGNWFQVKLRGTRSNRDAIGARVLVESGGRHQVREIASSGGYLAGQSLVVHFGLDDARRVNRLEVEWPSGRTTVLVDLEANRLVEIVEGDESEAVKVSKR
jgi:hypothetical protein